MRSVPRMRDVSLPFAIVGVFVAAFVAQGCNGPGLCIHGKNWPFKIGEDVDAARVSLDPVPTTIDALRALQHADRPEDRSRIAPTETTTFVLRDVDVLSFQRAPDGDVHMVLSDDHGHTMIAEAAPPFCCDDDSPWRSQIARVRSVVDAHVPMAVLGFRNDVVSLAGVGYFDSLHGQFSVADNGIELHPILAICWGRGCALPDPRSP